MVPSLSRAPSRLKRYQARKPFQHRQGSKVISEAAKKAFSQWMKETFGTEDEELQGQLLCQATSIVPDFVGEK